ncbi:MAG: copper resistance protein CopD [Nitrosopumilus sp. H8]|nr:MAG: copper resistance protein CopD [Nitrosopumilus sp. H8]
MKRYLAVLLILSMTVPSAAAHPFTEQTVPSLASNPSAGVTRVTAYYSEPVDIEFSELKVFDNSGDRVDNGDTAYHEGETSLVVTTSPLNDGVYTVSSKVLSKIDGHLVPDAFVFAVGNAIVDPSLLEKEDVDLVFLPEAGARFPGLVGQTIVLGAIIASLAVWGTHNRGILGEKTRQVERRHHSRFMSVTGIGLVLVFASDILMISVQTVRLEAPIYDTIGTYFGTVWLARLAITVLLLGIWFVLDKRELTRRSQIPLLAAALALVSTTTLIGHGAATGQTIPVILDYIHNIVAAAWIGGIFYFVFALLPSFSQLDHTQREKMSLASIPRFSALFIAALGVVIVTGPSLMWFVETDVGLITESLYGQLIMLKIALAGVMVGLGFTIQFRTQKSIKKQGTGIHRMLCRTLKVDVALGIALLGIVALLVNGTLPAGQIQSADADASYGYSLTEFTQNARFNVEISPFASGANTIQVQVSDPGGGPLYDSERVKVKVSNPSKGIAPIEVAMERGDGELFSGELTFGFSGRWQVEIEAQRNENPNESKILDLLVKPRLADIQAQIVEYELPEAAKPLYPLYHDGSIWISDPSAPRIWQFSPETQVFSQHTFEGITTTFLTADNSGNIWFIDTPGNQLGFLDTQSGQITAQAIPKLDPVISDNIPIAVQADLDGNIWVAITNKDRIIKYLPESGEFKEVRLAHGSLPFALAVDADGNVWYSASGSGKIGYIDPVTLQATEIDSDLQSPEALLFDGDGFLWIAEHTGLAITRYDPVFGTFASIAVPNPDALPFGMALDRYGNVWFAQHTVDFVGAYDPDNGDLIDIPIQAESSFVQFMASDEKGGVWFVEQNANKLGTIVMTELPVGREAQAAQHSVRYSEIASPLMALGIVMSSLFFVRAVRDRRRFDGMLT